MGWLKKLTKPISKVFDKIIPNEIKPALPYMAAFAPFMMGPQSGIMGSSMLRRALTSGAFNLGSQLAQEGSEGEFNPLSVLLAGSTGAMTSPDAPGFFEGMQKGPTGADQFGNISVPYSDTGIMSSISDAVGKGGQTAAKFLIEQGKVLRPDETPLTMTNALTAGALPVTQATGELAEADARRALRDYEDQMAADESMSLIDDDGRRRAIRAAMEAAGHLEEVIVETLGVLGLKQGGIVGLKKGGRVKYDRGGDYYSNFAKDRYASEMFENYGNILGQGEKLYNEAFKRVGTGEYPAPQDLRRLRKEYEDIENKYEQIENRYEGYEDKFSPEDEHGYYGKKYRDLEKRYEALEARGEPSLEGLEVIGITKSADFQNWLRLYEAGDPKAKEHPYHEEFEEILFETGYDKRMKGAKGGVASVLPKGKEADYRGGGVIPVGSRERADDVPARLSKNEFVMTADAVRAAGGGSINKGAKRMYNLMHNLEARV